MAKKKAPSIAAKVLRRGKATPEDAKTLAATVLGQNQSSGGSSSVAAKVLRGAKATPKESKTLAATVLSQQ
jgi:hypothetical protein